MAVFNHIVGALVAPLPIGILMLVAALAIRSRWRRVALSLAVASAVWTWAWSCPFMTAIAARPLERAFPDRPAAESERADAIVLLGGGMGADADECANAEMFANADRVWHAARLYRAGKAPIVIPTGCNDSDSVTPLLLDLGVPRDAIRVENQARNTEENAKFVSELLKGQPDGKKPKVLLVTSAQHMRRSMLMYERYASSLEIVPIATDYNVVVCTERPPKCSDYFPCPDYLQKNGCILKELVGYWGYRLLRR